MKRIVELRYFAAAQDAASREEEQLSLPETYTLGELKTLLGERYGEHMTRVLRSSSFLMDGKVRTDDSVTLSEKVDVLPPFSGG